MSLKTTCRTRNATRASGSFVSTTAAAIVLCSSASKIREFSGKTTACALSNSGRKLKKMRKPFAHAHSYRLVDWTKWISRASRRCPRCRSEVLLRLQTGSPSIIVRLQQEEHYGAIHLKTSVSQSTSAEFQSGDCNLDIAHPLRVSRKPSFP